LKLRLAVSPAFTCALPFPQYVCERIQQAVHLNDGK
jgi:hypothetical protein